MPDMTKSVAVLILILILSAIYAVAIAHADDYQKRNRIDVTRTRIDPARNKSRDGYQGTARIIHVAPMGLIDGARPPCRAVPCGDYR